MFVKPVYILMTKNQTKLKNNNIWLIKIQKKKQLNNWNDINSNKIEFRLTSELSLGLN